MNHKTLRRLAIGALALLSACSTEDAPGPLLPGGPVGRIRFVNLINDPARLPVNAILEGLPFGVNLAYGGTTPASLAAPNTAHYAQILTGARTLELERTADPSVTVATIAIAMTEEDRTVYATGGNAGGAVTNVQTVDDNTAPAAGQVRFRVVNLAPAADPVDVFITAAGADLSTAQPTFANLAVNAASGYVMTLAIHRSDTGYHPWTDPVVLSLAAMLVWLIAAELCLPWASTRQRGRLTPTRARSGQGAGPDGFLDQDGAGACYRSEPHLARTLTVAGHGQQTT